MQLKKIVGFFAYLNNKYYIVKKLSFILIVASTISAIATYIAITHNSSTFGPDPNLVMGLILIDLILLLSLAIIITKRITTIFFKKQADVKGVGLQGKIVVILCLLISVPTIITAIFSTLFFQYGIQSWFDIRVGTALEESVAVAESYLAEHRETIKSDAISMAIDINNNASLILQDSKFFNQLVASQAMSRALTEALVVQQNRIIARSLLSFSITLETFPVEMFERASTGEVVLLSDNSHDRVRALVKLQNFYDTYLIVGRILDQKVLDYTENTKGIVTEYRRLKSHISNLQIKFSIIFIAVSLLLLLATICLGIIFTSAIVKPISKLVAAVENVKSGRLSTRVIEHEDGDEINILEKAFNRMTAQLEKQQNALIEANHQIDARRHFSETVLSGVSAGVIALDIDKNVSMINKSAIMLLNINLDLSKDTTILEIFPEIQGLVEIVELNPEEYYQKQISVIRHSREVTLIVRIVAEQFRNATKGYVITFDDITELVLAQRSAAWADVARRVAHEIKNPLTPIHLATERLKKKYEKEVKNEKDFIRYIDMIARHVADISKIVEEFVNFARMPAPMILSSNLTELLQNIIYSRQAIMPNIRYELILPAQDVIINFDPEQIGRAIINLLKNAEESIENIDKDIQGIIITKLELKPKSVIITIKDNGLGFPAELFSRLTEPYITNKNKGTGLGLAIVKKIIDDHGANIEFFNNNNNGAIVKIIFFKKD